MARAYAETVWLGDQLDRSAAWNEILAVFGWAVGSERAKRWKPSEAADPDDSRAGAVVFHDAWPTKWPCLQSDIVNNHHAKYYQGDDDPGDWEEPNMVSFLSITEGTTFDFALSARVRIHDRLLTLARTWLQGALVHEGRGGEDQRRLRALPAGGPAQSRVTGRVTWCFHTRDRTRYARLSRRRQPGIRRLRLAARYAAWAPALVVANDARRSSGPREAAPSGDDDMGRRTNWRGFWHFPSSLRAALIASCSTRTTSPSVALVKPKGTLASIIWPMVWMKRKGAFESSAGTSYPAHGGRSR